MLVQHRNVAIAVTLCLSLLGTFATNSVAQSKDSSNHPNSDGSATPKRNADLEKDKDSSASIERLPGLTAAREAAALAFVKTHHKELSELLIYLREHDSRKYQQAIRELFRDSERLATIHGRNPEFYEIQLRAWVNRSRIQLLVAKLRMSDDASLRTELRKELVAEREIQLERFEAERAITATKLERLDEAISRAQAGDKEMDKKQADKRIDILIGKSANVSKPADPKQADQKAANQKPANQKPVNERPTAPKPK